MPRPPRTDELPIIRAYYELILWLMPKMGKFPRQHKKWQVLQGLSVPQKSPFVDARLQLPLESSRRDGST